MKIFTTLTALMFISISVFSQKLDYKNGIINVDGTDVAKVIKIKDKENFGLTSTYELQNLKGDKLIIATISTEFEAIEGDNSFYYYRFSFLPLNQVGIFALGKLGPEKAFAKLIADGGIVVNNELNAQKVQEFIAYKSKNPKVAIEYHLVKRNRAFPMSIKENEIYQGNVLVGKFKNITAQRSRSGSAFNQDQAAYYEISLPDGLIVARLNFIGGNNAQNFNVFTSKDKRSQLADISTKEVTKLVGLGPNDDPNFVALKRVTFWLVANQYL